jgi:hypothetical protein
MAVRQQFGNGLLLLAGGSRDSGSMAVRRQPAGGVRRSASDSGSGSGNDSGNEATGSKYQHMEEKGRFS